MMAKGNIQAARLSTASHNWGAQMVTATRRAPVPMLDSSRSQGKGHIAYKGQFQMDLNIQQSDGVSVVEARGRIDTVTSRTFSEGLTQLITSGATRVVIDLAHIAYISSAGFRSLLVAAKMIETSQGRLALSGLTGEVRRLFDIAAFTELFVICATQQEGIAIVTAGDQA